MPYYEEALKRSPGDIRSNNALGAWHLRRGQFVKSGPYFRAKPLSNCHSTQPKPLYDGEPYYNLGLSLYYQERINEAYDAFFKAAWSSAWQDSAYFSIAQIDVLRKGLRPGAWNISPIGRLTGMHGTERPHFVKVHTLLAN